MSHSSGEIRDDLGCVRGYFEYNGTVDVARPQIFATLDDLNDAWRQDQPVPCACAGVAVTLTSGQLTWDARACLYHGFIVHGLSPIYYQEED